MRKRAFVVLLALVLTTGLLSTASLAAEDLPEIDITWLSVSGKPNQYIRKTNALELIENSGRAKCLYLDSGEIISGGFADWWVNVQIPFEHGQCNIKHNSDGSPMGMCVADKEDKFGFVNTAGELIIPCEYHWIFPSDRAESFAVERDGKWGFVDANNELLFPFDWDEAYGFYEDRAPVARKDKSGNMKYGYIDRSGNVVIPLEYDDCGSFHEGLAVAAREDEYGYKKWGYIDPSGNVVVPLEYSYGRDFNEGLAAVGWEDVLGDNILWGCIDRSGHMVLPVEYEYSSRLDFYKFAGCQDGLIAAGRNGKYGCFDISGKTVLPLEYDDVKSLGDGMYMVQKGASYGIFESPYWRNSEFVPVHSSEVFQSPNIVVGTVVASLIVTVCAVGFLLGCRKKSDD